MVTELAVSRTSAPAGTGDDALGVGASFSGRRWRLRACNPEQVTAIERAGLSPAVARLLAGRGIPADDATGFLASRLKDLMPDPYVLAQMEPAARRLAAAVAEGQTIAVFGDYDVDGACSVALLLGALRALGREPLLYIPDRMSEGYGPSPASMRRLRAEGADLVVTVDCGAAASEALDAARRAGLDVIVLDHHAVETHPPAFAHVNPNAPGDRSGLTQLCAAGVTFFMLVAVQRVLRETGWFASTGITEPDLRGQLDLVALATVADVVPLTGVNRAFVRQGLVRLARLERPGLAALADVAGATAPFTAYHLGFVFGPRINAGGRVGRCDLGARLLSGDASEAEPIAAELDRHNRERQAIEAQILEAAHDMALAKADEPFLLLTGEGWHPGVVGIVASRLKDRHGKPVLVAGFEETGAEALGRGSARSVRGVDLGALIRMAREAGLLESGGGHAMAAGFSLTRNRLDDFSAFLHEKLSSQRSAIAAARDLVADSLLSAAGADLALLDDLDRAGPFGAGHPEPVFLLPEMHIAYARIVGTNHVRLRLVGADGAGLDAIGFRAAGGPLGEGLLAARGKRVHLAGKLKRDTYGGTERVQLHVEDAAPAGL